MLFLRVTSSSFALAVFNDVPQLCSSVPSPYCCLFNGYNIAHFSFSSRTWMRGSPVVLAPCCAPFVSPSSQSPHCRDLNVGLPPSPMQTGSIHLYCMCCQMNLSGDICVSREKSAFNPFHLFTSCLLPGTSPLSPRSPGPPPCHAPAAA